MVFVVYAARGDFRGVSEVSRTVTTWDFSLTMGAPLSGCNVSRGMHSRLNSSVTGFCFDLKLRKCSEDLFSFLFFGRHE